MNKHIFLRLPLTLLEKILKTVNNWSYQPNHDMFVLRDIQRNIEDASAVLNISRLFEKKNNMQRSTVDVRN